MRPPQDYPKMRPTLVFCLLWRQDAEKSVNPQKAGHESALKRSWASPEPWNAPLRPASSSCNQNNQDNGMYSQQCYRRPDHDIGLNPV